MAGNNDPPERAAKDSLLFGDTFRDAGDGRASSVGLAPGTMLGERYQLLDHLGSGGMGAVYSAHDRLLDQKVALKFLRRSLASDAGSLNRLRHEVRLAQSVTHVNVARTFTLDESDGYVFIVMELLRGVTLASRLQQGPLDVEEALRIGRDVLAGLASAHSRGVIHRDIKPSNIKLCDDGRVVLFDFGLARAGDLPSGNRNSLRLDLMEAPYQTHSVLCGTPGYIAPEVVNGAPASASADLYAFGVVLFEMLAGRPPFSADTPTELVQMHVSASPPEIQVVRSEVSEKIASTLHRLLQKDPAERLSTADETRAALDPSRLRSVWTTTPQPRRVSVPLVVAAVLLALAAGGLAFWRARVRSSTSAQVAQPAISAAAQTAVPMPTAPLPVTRTPSPPAAEAAPASTAEVPTRPPPPRRKHSNPSAPTQPAGSHDPNSDAAHKRQRMLELEQ